MTQNKRSPWPWDRTKRRREEGHPEKRGKHAKTDAKRTKKRGREGYARAGKAKVLVVTADVYVDVDRTEKTNERT